MSRQTRKQRRSSDSVPPRPALRLVRQPGGIGPTQDRRWWQVLDGAGVLVGLVVEVHHVPGYESGPSIYTVVEQPGVPWPFGTCWRSEGHRTPVAAMKALAARVPPRVASTS